MRKGIGGNEGVWLKSLARTSFLGVCGKGEVARLSLHAEREARGSPNRAKLEGTLSPHARVHSKTHIHMRATHSNIHIHVPMQAHEYTHRHTQAHMCTHINIGEHKHTSAYSSSCTHMCIQLSAARRGPSGLRIGCSNPHILEVSLHRVASVLRDPWNRCGGGCALALPAGRRILLRSDPHSPCCSAGARLAARRTPGSRGRLWQLAVHFGRGEEPQITCGEDTGVDSGLL